MGFLDKVKNKLQMGRGHVKQDAGRAMGDPYLESEGQADRVARQSNAARCRGRERGQSDKRRSGNCSWYGHIN